MTSVKKAEGRSSRLADFLGAPCFVAIRSLRGRKQGVQTARIHSALKSPSGALAGRPVSRRVSGGLGGAVLGIALSLVPLVLVMIVADGMIRGITDRYIETSTYHIQIAMPPDMDKEAMDEALALALRIQGVRATYREQQGVAVLASPYGTHAALVRAVDASFFADPGLRDFLVYNSDRAAPAPSSMAAPALGSMAAPAPSSMAAPAHTAGTATTVPTTEAAAPATIAGAPPALPRPLAANEILLGSALAESLGVQKGSLITVMTASGGATAAGIQGEGARDKGGARTRLYGGATAAGIQGAVAAAPRVALFKVVGTVQAGYRDLDQLWAFVNPEAGARLLAPDLSRTVVGIKTQAAYGPSLYATQDALGARFAQAYPSWFEPAYIRSWPEVERSLFSSFSTTKLLLTMVLALAVLVAAINLGSALSVFVAERRTDIAVLRACGASGQHIRVIFLAAGLVTGAAGTAIGLLSGAVLAWRINDLVRLSEWIVNSIASLVSGGKLSSIHVLNPAYYLTKIPVLINFYQLLTVALASIGLCVLASIVPARRASLLSPMELLRKT